MAEIMSEMGRGFATLYEVLTLEDSMTVATLIERLKQWPPTAKISISGPSIRVEPARVQIPVAVRSGRLSDV